VSDSLELHGEVWLTLGEQNFGSPARIALLAKIAECGSITAAAKAAGMSYKAAWDAIDAMNNLSGEPLVARLAGGKGGGGTRLTARGRKLVDNFYVVEREHRQFIEQLNQQAGNIADDLLLIRRIGMKTSARNQFFARVVKVRPGAVNDEIDLEMAGGQKLAAIVTHESTDTLDLKPGAETFALVKASSVLLVTEPGGAKFSARNQLAGSVSRVSPGAVNTEVILDLSGGASVVAIITNESCAEMGLAPGVAATAMFKASCIILCMPA
jgi:molybdate transport system regulatory protein